MEESKLNDTKEIVRTSEKYVLWGGGNGNHGLVLSSWGGGYCLGFGLRPNLHLIPDMDAHPTQSAHLPK